jgi:tRNA (cmo5U34)-methyltransferase
MAVNESDDASQDKIVPGQKWEFDENVTACFDQMLQRSIPSYDTMRDLVFNLGTRFVNAADNVIDIGASRGEAIARLVEAHPRTTFKAIEVSKPMADVLRQRFVNDKVLVTEDDLRYNLSSIISSSNSLVLSILTLQFIPVEYRQRIVTEIYASMPRNSAFILVEKILGSSYKTSDLMIEEYHKFKSDNGYSYEDIERKRASLEGVLVPITYAGNMELMRGAGFTNVECFWRHLNFCGWICIK